jgi:hypothetical protein
MIVGSANPSRPLKSPPNIRKNPKRRIGIDGHVPVILEKSEAAGRGDRRFLIVEQL